MTLRPRLDFTFRHPRIACDSTNQRMRKVLQAHREEELRCTGLGLAANGILRVCKAVVSNTKGQLP